MFTQPTLSRRPSRIRQADVARQAGVSQATVSIVLGDRDTATTRVSAETRSRVRQVADELGYVVDPVARNLVGGRNSLLGVYTFEPVFPADALDFYQAFLVGIERAAEVAGYDLLLFTSSVVTPHTRAIYSHGVNRLALSDGSILLGRNEDKQELRRLCSEEFPFVYVGRRDVGAEMWHVTADYRSATQHVIDHLRGLGHDRIAYIGRANPHEPDLDRAAAWTDCSAELSEAPLVRFAKPVGPELIRDLVDRRGITALVLENPEFAHHVFAATERAGLSVPEELSVAVLGDDPRFARGPRIWTGFQIPREAMGQAAVRLLIKRLEGDSGPSRSLSLSCPFEAGNTATRPFKGGSR